MIRQITLVLGIAILFATSQAAALVFPYTVDFSTEDDDVTPLVNGQAIDTEFGILFTITSTVDGGGSGHLGPTIFDSDPTGPNSGGGDPDLLVDLGNILILQNDALPTQTVPGIFDEPDDEAQADDEGTIIFNFIDPVELLAIDLVDVNGGAAMLLTLTDSNGLSRVYDVPEKWTNDVTVAPDGYDTLLLTSLLPQDGEGSGGDATAAEDALFDPTDVVELSVSIFGSGGIDNLVIGSLTTQEIPEPTSGLLLLTGLVAGMSYRRR